MIQSALIILQDKFEFWLPCTIWCLPPLTMLTLQQFSGFRFIGLSGFRSNISLVLKKNSITCLFLAPPPPKNRLDYLVISSQYTWIVSNRKHWSEFNSGIKNSNLANFVYYGKTRNVVWGNRSNISTFWYPLRLIFFV